MAQTLEHRDGSCVGDESPYKKRKGTVDYGKGYEHLTCTYYALELSTRGDVDHFQMTTNNEECGDFDDIEIKLKFKNGETCRLLFQLKYRLNKEYITSDMLTKETMVQRNKKQISSKYYLPKYFKSVSEFQSHHENTIFILYTNASTDIESGTTLSFKNFPTLVVRETSDLERQILLDHRGTAFQFKDSGQAEIDKFYFLANQRDIDTLRADIQGKLKRIFNNNCDIFHQFLQFMEHWWNEDFVLTKHIVLTRVAALALFPIIKPISDGGCNDRTELLKEVLLNFDMTILTDELVCHMWPEVQEECDPRRAHRFLQTEGSLTPVQKTVFLWYSGKVPLIVRVDQENRELVKCVMELLKESDNKVVLLGESRRSHFEGWSIFENLFDAISKDKIGCEKIVKTFKFSFQGRLEVSLEDLINTDANVARIVGVDELCKVAKTGTLHIGKQLETLSSPYIMRTISVDVITWEYIKAVYGRVENHLFVINCNDELKKILHNDIVLEVDEYLSQKKSNYTPDFILVSTKKKCTFKQFEEISTLVPKTTVYLLQAVDLEYCMLSLQTGTNKLIHFTKKYIPESQIWDYCQGPLNVFCAPPGMGKSTLMKALSQSAQPHSWTIYVDLINYKSKENFGAIWKHFFSLGDTDSFTHKMKDFLWRTRKIHLFLDGLDEINTGSLGSALKFVKHLSDQGVHVWVSSRENLRTEIVQSLKVVPNEIQALDQNQQRECIAGPLDGLFATEKVEEITAELFRNADLNNSEELLGVPLHLSIITQMLVSDPQSHKQNNLFVLPQLYEHYFKGKLNRTSDLVPLKRLLSKDYEKLALKSCLDPPDFEKLDVDTNELEEIIVEMKEAGDKCGIVKNINLNNEAVFVHQTYAEYFACCWFKKNKNRFTKLKMMASSRYDNLRVMFDLMMAEDKPLHMGVIYQSVEQVMRHKTDVALKDKVNRTALHLASGYGRKYPEKLSEGRFVRRETDNYVKIMGVITQEETNLDEVDTLFELNVVNFALESRCLYPIEKFLEMKLLDFKDIKGTVCKYYHLDTLAYYSAKMGYPHLLSHVIDLVSKKDLLELAAVGCPDDDYTIPRDGNLAAISVLIERGGDVNKGLPSGNSLLDIACRLEIYDTLKILMNHGAKCSGGDTVLHGLLRAHPPDEQISKAIDDFDVDINTRNNKGETVLHLACERGGVELLQKLLTKGSNFQVVDCKNRSALHYACQSDEDNTDVVEFLLKEGLDVNAVDIDDASGLHYACENGNFEITKLLLDRGANAEAVTSENETVLHYAARCQHKNDDIITFLITAHGCRVNAKTKSSKVPLHCAAMSGVFENAEMLLNRGADVNSLDKHRRTPLHYSLDETQNEELVSLLLCNDADIDIPDVNFITPLHIACENRNSVEILLDYPQKPQQIWKKIHSNIASCVDVQDIYGRTPLHIACLNGDFENVETLICRVSDVNLPDNNLNTPLHIAVASRNMSLDIINLLVSVQIAINARNESGQTAIDLAEELGRKDVANILRNSSSNVVANLDSSVVQNSEMNFLQACMSGRFEIVKEFLRTESAINCKDHRSNTGLHFAALSTEDNVDIIRILARYLDIDSVNQRKETPLHFATGNGNVINMKHLLENGAHVNCLDLDGNTPLHCALDNISVDSRKVDLLIKRGSNVNIANDEGKTALHIACGTSFEAVEFLMMNGGDVNLLDNEMKNMLHFVGSEVSTDPKLIDLLVSKGVLINQQDKFGATPLHYASQSDLNIVKKLIQKGADINVQDFDQLTPLHYALDVSQEHREIVEFLASQWVDLDFRTTLELTLLHHACRSDAVDVKSVQIILEAGADLHAVDEEGGNALHLAAFNTNPEVVEFLIKQGLDVDSRDNDGYTPLHNSCQSGSTVVVKALLDNSANPNVVNEDDENALHCAAASVTDKEETMELLLNFGVHINARNKEGSTPLHLALKANCANNALVLMSFGADFKLVDNRGQNAFHYMSQSSFCKTILVPLLIHENDINLPNVDGATPILLACRQGEVNTVKLFLGQGADLSCVDKEGRTALHYAKEFPEKNEMLIKFLRNRGLSD